MSAVTNSLYSRTQDAAVLKSSAKQRLPEDVLKKYNISELAVEALFLYLGNGDIEKGLLKFEKYAARKLIHVEQVGFDKFGQEKFYIMIRKQKVKGGWNQFHIGISRKGTPRAVLRPLEASRNDATDLENARELRQKLGKKYRGPISRLMNDANGIKVTELGGEDLWALIYDSKLTRQDRLTIYKSLIQGVHQLHSLGFVHTDLKLANIVVDRDVEGKIVGVKIVDFDRLKKIGESHRTKIDTRYIPYSPERMSGGDNGVADPKDDIWAVMCVICEMESKVAEGERLVPDEMIARFLAYQEDLEKGADVKDFYAGSSLFKVPAQNTLFSNMIVYMGKISSAQRPVADRISPLLELLR